MNNQRVNQLMEVTEQINQLRFFEKFSQIPLGEFAILKIIWQNQAQNKPTTVSELAEIFNLTQAAISRTIKTLTDKDWVVKRPCSEDKRFSYLSLTELGQEAYQRQHKIFDDKFSNVLNGMSQERFDEFIMTLNQMYRAMKGQISQLENEKGCEET